MAGGDCLSLFSIVSTQKFMISVFRPGIPKRRHLLPKGGWRWKDAREYGAQLLERWSAFRARAG